jgi:hypothetical protein
MTPTTAENMSRIPSFDLGILLLTNIGSKITVSSNEGRKLSKPGTLAVKSTD